MDTVAGFVAIAGGIALMLFRKGFVDGSIKFQTAVFGFKYSDSIYKIGYWLVPVFGAAFVVIGGIYVARGLGWL